MEGFLEGDCIISTNEEIYLVIRVFEDCLFVGNIFTQQTGLVSLDDPGLAYSRMKREEVGKYVILEP